MSTWIVSDTHFFHELLAQARGFSTVPDMNAAIIELWNNTIAPEDKVFHLGDFAFGNDFTAIEELLKQLNGKIMLLGGNHDTPKKMEIYAKHFKIATAFVEDKILLTHCPVHPMVLDDTKRKQPICYNVHGHMHSGAVPDNKYFNVCWDAKAKKFWKFSEVKQQLLNQTSYEDGL